MVNIRFHNSVKNYINKLKIVNNASLHPLFYFSVWQKDCHMNKLIK